MAGPWEEYQGREDGPWAEYAGPVQDLPAVQVRPDPTEGMSALDRFRAGLGKSLVDTGYGLAQSVLFPRVPGVINRAADSVDEAIGSPAYSRLRKDVMGLYNAPRQALERKIADRREIDEPLMNTGSGIAGNVTGALAQMLGPAFLARGTSAASVVLPTTLRANLLQGAALGAAQPSLSDEERLINAGIGGAAGWTGAAVPKVAGATLRSARSLLDPFTDSGAAAKAAEVVRAFAEDPARLAVRQPSSIPGVRRTLAEETLDPGIAQLQRTVAAREGATFDSMRRSNNAARVNAIRGFSGDEAGVAAAKAARDEAVQADLNAAMQAGPVDIRNTRAYLDEAIEGAEGLAEVQPALTRMRGLLSRVDPEDAGKRIPEDRIRVLENIRRTIGHGLEGKFSGDGGAALSGSRELIGLRDTLNSDIAGQVPEFGNYLGKFREMSKPINRMETAQELLKRASVGTVDPVTGLEVLTPAKFGQNMRNLDQIAASATGFDKAKAANILQPSDMKTLRGIENDLSRQNFADSAARGSGSDTFQKLMTDGDIIGAVQEMGVNIPGAGLIRMLGKSGKERVNRQLVNIMVDPARAQEILKSANASDRKVIQDVLTAMGGRSGTALAVGSSD